MKKKWLLILVSLVLITFGYILLQNYNRIFSVQLSDSDSLDIPKTNIKTDKRLEFSNTVSTWKDSKGDEYPVYMAYKGSCFVIKTSKSGEEYRAYLGEEASEQINKELSNRKSNDVVVQDTVSSFFGKPIVINDKIYDQISAIATQDKMLSYSDSIIQIGNVRWRVNLKSDNIVLMTSVQPDDPKMKQVVKYITGIYGKPYENEEDGYDIKWSSPDNTSDTFRPHSTFVHLRRVHSEEGGTFLFFK
jgi:hypothetical protein